MKTWPSSTRHRRLHLLLTGLLMLGAVVRAEDDRAQTGDKRLVTHINSLLAVVGGFMITTEDVNRHTRKLEAGPTGQTAAGRKKIAAKRQRLAIDLVEDNILRVQFNAEGYQVPPQTVEKRILKMAQEQADGNLERFKEQLRRRHMDLDDLREEVRLSMIARFQRGNYVRDAIVAPQAVLAYYHEHKHEQFTRPGAVVLQQLSIDVAALTPAERKARTDEIQAALDRDMDFAEAVRRFSEGYARDRGGQLPQTRLDELNQAYRQALKGVGQGQTTKAFQLEDELVWLHVKGRQPGGVVPYRQAAPRIQQLLRQRRAATRRRDHLRQLRKRTYIRSYL